MSQVPFHLLELNLISAQDLAPVSRKNLRTYAVAWINPERKLRTRIDNQGHVNPTWNDKFVFRVDDKFLNSDSSALMIEIYALGWWRDIPVGSVRVLMVNLIPPSIQKQNNSSRRFVALQIRRPSGRPQGILNLGVTLLDNTMRSMPLYTEISASAFGYHDLMEERNNNNNDNYYKKNQKEEGEKKISEEKLLKAREKVKLWRSRSDKTGLNSTVLCKHGHKTSSVYNGSVVNGSVINGSVVNGSVINGSCVNGSIVNGSICSDLGPSPSVVAAAVAKGLYPTQLPAPHKPGSSILGDWTVEECSAEGLKTKIERWKMELPPIYDRRGYQKMKKELRHSRRATDGGGGLCSCFGNAYGFEVSIVCGANNESLKKGKRSASTNKLNSPSSDLDSF